MTNKLSFIDDNHAFVVLSTMDQKTINNTAWMVIGEWNQLQNGWVLKWILQSDGSGQPTTLVLGPSEGNTKTVGIVYVASPDGATESAYVLGITPKSVNVLRHITLSHGTMAFKDRSFEIDGYNYREVDSWQNGLWSVEVTPLSQLLHQAGLQVQFVVEQNGQTLGPVSVIGPSQLTAKAGQTISFIPSDAFTEQQLKNYNIAVYIHSPGNPTPMQFDMVDMLRDTTYQFSNPGQYEFYVVPGVANTPDPNVDGIVTVTVTK